MTAPVKTAAPKVTAKPGQVVLDLRDDARLDDLTRDQLFDDLDMLRFLIVEADDEDDRKVFWRGYEARCFAFALSGRPTQSISQALETGQKAGVEKGVKAGYQAGYSKGVSDGEARAKAAAAASTAVHIEVLRDQKTGRPMQVLEHRSDGSTVTKTISHGPDGRVIAISQEPTPVG